MSRAYYNEFDPGAAAWLRNLIAAGLIAPGDVDERSIEDVSPSDLAGYTQCHFFAGIGVWSYALRRAGWPDDRPVWTGSCPCQPFSSAGAQAGFADERHLWPAFHWLIEQCRPAVVFGEQVASKAVDPWIDLVQADVEALGYSFGGIPFPAASVGAPHIRDRLYWVADVADQRFDWRRTGSACNGRDAARQQPERFCDAGGMADADDAGSQGYGRSLGQHVPEGRETERRYGSARGMAGGVADAHGGELQGVTVLRGTECNGEGTGRSQGGGEPRSCGEVLWLADADGNRCDQARQRESTTRDDGSLRNRSAAEGEPATGPVNGYWRAADWIFCRDGKWRPVEPGTFPLAHGAPARVVRLRAYGNAINAQAAQAFIESFVEAKRLASIL